MEAYFYIHVRYGCKSRRTDRTLMDSYGQFPKKMMRSMDCVKVCQREFSFTEKSLADIINMTHRCHVELAMI